MTDDVMKQLNTAMRQIRRAKWFNKDWTLRATEPDDGRSHWAGIQLAKKNWFNEDGLGIHIETWVSEKEMPSNQLPFVLHVLHQKTFPGTDKTTRDFMKLWRELPEPNELIASWPGYKTGRIKPLGGKRKYDLENIPSTIVEEFTRLHVLDVYVDQVLSEILGD
jgi:hypothetical protein